MHLLPQPQKTDYKDGFLKCKQVCIQNHCQDKRIEKVLEKLPRNDQGVVLELRDDCMDTEGYTLQIEEDKIIINGDSSAGVFYGLQTLRQIFEHDKIPCLLIEDRPGFEYRGFYHDVTRGKIPTVETLKKLIDQMAYYKMNSLQLYIEHTFPFQEFGDHIEVNGYLTPEEIMELDQYCYENFIDLIPSIATFGHLYELLQMEKYRDLQELEGFQEDQLYWYQRMAHHTINPTDERSIEIIKSMIDQFVPLFRTNKFNICCDETFDLKNGKHVGQDIGRIYIDFVKQIISHLHAKGKTVMMWADILLQHPETIDELPDHVEFLNWDYRSMPPEEAFEKFGKLPCTQIVCPGTGTWSRLVEAMDKSSMNILKLGDYGYKYGAKGMLNTNWGDYGNPCSIELCMHGLVLGAAKSWNSITDRDERFEESINYLLYKNERAVEYLVRLDEINKKLNWNTLAKCYSNCIYEKKFTITYPLQDDITWAQAECMDIIHSLEEENWTEDSYRLEMILAAQGLLVMAELYAKHAGYYVVRYSDTEQWLKAYRSMWLKNNKESELFRIEDMFRTLEKYEAQ